MAGDLELTAVPGGTRLRLRVKAGARRTAILGVHGGALKIAVAAAPERGKANRAVASILADTVGVAPSAITIASGEASQDKVVEIAMSADRVRAALTRTLADLD